MNIEYLKVKEKVIVDALFRVSALPITKPDEPQKDVIPAHMFTTELSTDSTSVAEFRKATAEDTTSGLLKKVVMNFWPESRKDCHLHLLDYWTCDSSSLKSFVTELFRPSMKATSVLQRFRWGPKSQYSGQR